MHRRLINRATIDCKSDVGDDLALGVAQCVHNAMSQVKKVLCPRLKLCEVEE